MIKKKFKPCSICKQFGHFPYQCFRNTKKQKPIPRSPLKRKPDTAWLKTRKRWFKNHPPDENGYYWCQIEECRFPGLPMLPNEVELDHIKPRSAFPELKHVDSNLRPSHGTCNHIKGGKH